VVSMDALPLDPSGYTGTYKLVGGRLSLDLANTISWPQTDREHDWFAIPANVDVWLEANGLDSPPISESDLPAIHQIRKAVSDLLRPLTSGERPDPKVIHDYNSLLSDALSRKCLSPEDLTWTWAPPERVRQTLDPVVLDAAELAAAGSHDRLKRCPSCDWLFEDQTRNGQRRWCDMADCGSRDKARRYYHRHKA